MVSRPHGLLVAAAALCEPSADPHRHRLLQAFEQAAALVAGQGMSASVDSLATVSHTTYGVWSHLPDSSVNSYTPAATGAAVDEIQPSEGVSTQMCLWGNLQGLLAGSNTELAAAQGACVYLPAAPGSLPQHQDRVDRISSYIGAPASMAVSGGSFGMCGHIPAQVAPEEDVLANRAAGVVQQAAGWGC